MNEAASRGRFRTRPGYGQPGWRCGGTRRAETAESQSASRSPAEADLARSESVSAVGEWLAVGGTGTADNYNAERPGSAPSAATINARFGWGTILDETIGFPVEQRPQDPVWVCRHSFPPPEDCEFPLGRSGCRRGQIMAYPRSCLTCMANTQRYSVSPVNTPVNGCPCTSMSRLIQGMTVLARSSDKSCWASKMERADGESVGENGGHWFLYPKS